MRPQDFFNLMGFKMKIIIDLDFTGNELSECKGDLLELKYNNSNTTLNDRLLTALIKAFEDKLKLLGLMNG